MEEFALHGPAGANMRAIAERSGISVGALYKYYGDKDGFFRACLDRSLEALDQTLAEVTAEPAGFKEYAGRIIRALLRFSRDHAGYVRLYCALAASGGEEAAGLAGEIEGVTARLYARTIAAGQAAGDLRRDMDPGLLAFFFDSLLMMVQFAGCCGTPEDREARLEAELLKFLESAFTFEEAEIVHGARERSPSAPAVCEEGYHDLCAGL